MKGGMLATGVSAVTLLLLATQIKALSVGFGETDYQANEGNGGRYVVVQKVGENVGDLVLTVTTLRYNEVDPNQIPDEITNLPDEAEFSDAVDGRKDFYRVEETIVVPASGSLRDTQVFLPFYDDKINEETEGYFAVVRINASASDPRDVASLDYIRNGISLIIINDDDEIRISFEKESYVVPEENSEQNELVKILKQDGTLTERTLEVLVQLGSQNGFDDAVQGEDFDIESDTLMFTFQPDTGSIFIPFSVKDDTIAEHREKFILLLSVPTGGGWRLGTIQTTTVFIEDNDEAIVGFENEVYTAREEDGSVEVCVRLLSSNDIELFVDGTIQLIEGTANVETDFESVGNQFFLIFNEQTRECFSIPLVDDSDAESTESFTVTISTLMPSNVLARPNTTTVVIVDGDFNTNPPTCDCDDNAECVDVSPTERKCICNHGYTGNGTTCTDIDECTEGKHRCSNNAYCTNIPGSYQCQCEPGYTGNGVICRDINECTKGTHRCSNYGYCINLPGSYRCKCKWGFSGNGIICRDINECFTNKDKCSKYAYCRNTIGDYQCYCRPGFSGDGITCSDIDECRTNQHECSYYAKCHNTIGSYECHCKRGYEGDGYTCTRSEDEKTKTKTKTRTKTGTRSHSRTPHSRTPRLKTNPRNRMNDDEQEDKSGTTHTMHTRKPTHTRTKTRSRPRHTPRRSSHM